MMERLTIFLYPQINTLFPRFDWLTLIIYVKRY